MSAGAQLVEVEIEADAWTTDLPEAADLARQAAAAALAPGEAGEVMILLTDDVTVADLNRRFRGKDTPTNVLSFPAAAFAGGALGDIALAHGVCAAEARAQGKSLGDHLRHLVIHGVLHLLGHDHEGDEQAEAMEGLERRLLATLGVADPYGPPPMGEDARSAAVTHDR